MSAAASAPTRWWTLPKLTKSRRGVTCPLSPARPPTRWGPSSQRSTANQDPEWSGYPGPMTLQFIRLDIIFIIILKHWTSSYSCFSFLTQINFYKTILCFFWASMQTIKTLFSLPSCTRYALVISWSADWWIYSKLTY